MENLEKIDKYRAIIKQILSQYASYKPSYGDIEIQTLFDTEQDLQIQFQNFSLRCYRLDSISRAYDFLRKAIAST